MDKLTLKKRILDAARHSQQEIVNTLRGTARERLRSINDSLEDDETEPFETAREEELESVDRDADGVNTATNQLDLLQRMHVERLHEQVSPGSVVITDFRNFFVSTSLTDFTVDNSLYLGISTESSIYQQLKDKKKGDTFSIQGASHQILDVF